MMSPDFTPRILEETSAGLCAYDIRDEMLRHREVECVGEIDAQMVYSLCRQLRYLQRQDPEKEITMFINSPGGSVTDGLALYDVMRGLTCPVRTVCLGKAASMGAILFAAGSGRDILPNGRVMIHDPLITGGAQGSALAVQETSRQLMETRKTIGTILAQCTGKTLNEIYRKTRRDTWFNAQEAVDFGLADRVVTHICAKKDEGGLG